MFDKPEFVQALIHKGLFQAGFFQEGTGIDRRFEPLYFFEPLFDTSLTPSLGASQEKQESPYKEEKAEKNKAGEDQQRIVLGLDNIMKHQSLP
ncbi:MAG: hypothetical protein P8168_03745 [Deltaproteobacteria bacterium]